MINNINIKTWRWIVLILVLLMLGIQSYSVHPWMLDDAFISFRYAENLADGHGLVYNPGERVEGYTTFLWVIILSFFYKIGFSTVVTSVILGFVFTIATLLLLLFSDYFFKKLPPRVSLGATLIAGSSGVFTTWAKSGMENSMFSFLLLLTVLLFIKGWQDQNKKLFLGSGIAVALLSLTRPEGLIVFALLFFSLLIINYKKFKHLLFFSAPLLLSYIPYFLIRYLYYGYLLPNTFYVKVGSSIDQLYRGFEYSIYFLQATIPIWLFLLILLIYILLKKLHYQLLIPILIFFTWISYVIVVGGDIMMPSYRFFSPIIPIISLCASLGIFLLINKISIHKKIFLFLVLVIITFNIYSNNHDPNLNKRIKLYDTTFLYGKETGQWLNINVSANSTIAVNTAGTIPYYSKLYTIDMLGLNDIHIGHKNIQSLGSGATGHEKGDGDYVLSKKPDYIIIAGATGSSAPMFRGDFELFDNQEFHKNYQLKQYTMDSGNILSIYEKK